MADIRVDNLQSKISPRILIVEDELLIAKGIQRCLRTYNYSDTHIALNGEKAIDKVADIHPNIILMDIMLKEGIDGIQTAKEIRSRYDIPVIYLTSYSDKETLERAKQTEPYGYILKPFGEKELVSCIEIALYKHKMEKRLKKREKWYSTVLKSIGDAVITTDPNGIITFINPVAEKVTGYEYKEAVGQKLSNIFVTVKEDTAASIQDPITHVLKEGLSLNPGKDIILIARDGTKKLIIESIAPITDDEGTIAGNVIVFQDFTEHKKMERELADSEERFRSMVNAITSYTYSVEVKEDNTISTTHSAGCLTVTGYSPQDYKADPFLWYTMIFPEDREKIEAYIKQLFSGKQVSAFEHRLIHRDGNVVWVRNTTVPYFSADGRLNRYDSVIENITEKKRLEEMLLHSQKMDAVGKLTGGIAHDFNNLLTAIIGFAQILQLEIGADQRFHYLVQQILLPAERATNLIKALLSFSRKQVINPKPVDLNEVIYAIEKLLQRLIGDNIDITTDLAEQELTIMADTTQIEQVIMNLATNARDAMPEGGALIIRTEVQELDNDFIQTHRFQGQPGKFVLLSIQDTGKGMTKETLSRIFEPFFTSKEEGKGTGLGLSVTYGIVEQHNGYIKASSEPGQGAKFEIYLPWIMEKSGIRDVKSTSHLKAGVETILIVEDNDPVRKVLKEWLEMAGYTVLEADNGESAIRIYQEYHDIVQILLIDMVIPKMSGEMVYEAIKKMNHSIKVLFMSGYSENLSQKKDDIGRSFDFLIKPILPIELLRKVREVLDKA